MRKTPVLMWAMIRAVHVAAVLSAVLASGAEHTEQVLHQKRGRITGIVVNSVMGEAIVGAYVGVGDFGDSSGSNYARHRAQGLFAKAKTDDRGRFELDGLTFTDEHPYLDYHPLVVTHPGFVRHDEQIELPKSEPVPHITVSLRPAAKINVMVVDSNGEAVEGFWWFRLEALDGRRFIPLGRDPHLSSFASSVWMEMPKLQLSGTTGFSFTELESGEYSIDVIRFVKTDNYAPPPAGMVRLPLDTSKITYYGGAAKVEIEAAQAKDVQIKPADYQTSVAIKMPEDPIKKPQIPPFIVISRNVGLLVWDDRKAHGPEDHRLGRLQKNALYYNMVVDGDVLKIKNLPPGSYSVFAGPIYFMSAARMEVSRGDDVIVDIPPIQVSEHAKVGLWTFDRRVQLEARNYTAAELCELISEKTDSNPRIIADLSIANEKVRLKAAPMTIWDLLESVYLDKGWKLEEQGEKTLLLRSGVNAHVEAASEP